MPIGGDWDMKNHKIIAMLFLGWLIGMLGPIVLDALPVKSVDREAEFKKHMKLKADSIFKTIRWREVGPYFMGGRLTDIEGYEHRPYTFLIASASGGLWITRNNGTSWESLFDQYSSITLGDIAVSQTDEKLIWAGTGEENSSRSSYAGTGIFKSIDGGKNWQNMGLHDSHHISDIVIDPKNNDIVYVAVLGHLYSENEQRGIFKTNDGGKSWLKILYVNQQTGFVSLKMDPSNPQVLYAASWDRKRRAWNMTESGTGSAIFKTSNGGKHWDKIVRGFPQDQYTGRIGLAVSRSKPDTIYAFLDNQTPRSDKIDKEKMKDANYRLLNSQVVGAEVYRSDDGGMNWKRTHREMLSRRIVSTYGYYFGQIYVSPDNENTLFILGVPLMKSIDGGKSFFTCPKAGGSYGVGLYDVHPDHQALWIDPKYPDRILLGNDGGLNISYDGGLSFDKINNIPLAQCYTVNIDHQKPYRIYTGLQDNGINVGPSDFRFGSRTYIWKMILGGDGAFVVPDRSDPDTVYAEYQFGNIFRIHLTDSKKRKYIKPKPDKKGEVYRFNWLSPFMISHHNPFILYIGGNKMLKSMNRGDSWFEFSPDLSDQKNIDGDVPYATITALDESRFSPRILYAGTDDGNAWVTLDGGTNWRKIINGLPKKWVTRIIASKFKRTRVYLAMTGYREDDFKTYLFRSEDHGENWTSIRGNLPEESVNVIREDPVNENILYLGTELSVFVSLNRGEHWFSLRGNLPTNAVYDLKVHPRERELVIGTHGRGVFITSVRHIQELSREIMDKAVHLFDQKTIRLPRSRYQRFERQSFAFYQKEDGELEIAVYPENQRKAVFKLKKYFGRGLGAFQWDMRVQTVLKTVQKDKKMIRTKGNSYTKRGKYVIRMKKGKAIEKKVFSVQ